MKTDVSRFLNIHGRNGAEFFFSTGTFPDWKKSLEFYRGVSVSAKIRKALLTVGYPVLKFMANCSSKTVAETIRKQLDIPVAVVIPEHASAMISPTHDKAIIHYHGRGYEKTASGKSLSGVRKELEVYQRLQEKQPESFAFSKLGTHEHESESKSDYVRFFMNCADGIFSEAVPAPERLLPALAEFFSCGNCHTIPWKTLLDGLLMACPELESVIPPEMFAEKTPVGLVHRDFKPWNVKSGEKPLFFDFEAASFEGCPLEDLFNYVVDPLIRVTSAEQVVQERLTLFVLGKKLLEMQNLSTEHLMQYWHWYLLERIAFWKNQGQSELSEKFSRILLGEL